MKKKKEKSFADSIYMLYDKYIENVRILHYKHLYTRMTYVYSHTVYTQLCISSGKQFPSDSNAEYVHNLKYFSFDYIGSQEDFFVLHIHTP